jgi:hypothetical protein
MTEKKPGRKFKGVWICAKLWELRAQAVPKRSIVVAYPCDLEDGEQVPDRELVDALAEEFGLSPFQTSELSGYAAAYVLEKAQIVRSSPQTNLVGSFLTALRKDWKSKKASPKSTPKKKPVPLPSEPTPEQKTTDKAMRDKCMAQLRASIKEIALQCRIGIARPPRWEPLNHPGQERERQQREIER